MRIVITLLRDTAAEAAGQQWTVHRSRDVLVFMWGRMLVNYSVAVVGASGFPSRVTMPLRGKYRGSCDELQRRVQAEIDRQDRIERRAANLRQYGDELNEVR